MTTFFNMPLTFNYVLSNLLFFNDHIVELTITTLFLRNEIIYIIFEIHLFILYTDILLIRMPSINLHHFSLLYVYMF